MTTPWVTYRQALELGFTTDQIRKMEFLVVQAPNGISWTAYKIRPHQ